MATTIRETCLDEHDTPNEHSVRIQTALTESFPEESLLFVPNTCSVFRRKDRHHTRSQRFLVCGEKSPRRPERRRMRLMMHMITMMMMMVMMVVIASGRLGRGARAGTPCV